MGPYGVDLEFFHPDADENPGTGSFKVLFVGQPVRQKGLHYLLEAWRRLNLPNSELCIVARSGRNNPVLSRYKSEFAFLQDLDWMRLREEYRRADLVCLPSLSEGFGLVTLESLACGTPVLTSTTTGSSEVISHGQDGFVVPAADLQALMAALEFAYSDRDCLKGMRCAARKKAERFPWNRFRQRLREAVQSPITATA
jgi:glycosyltransferase involved in cell wall biosynthesis